MTPVNIILAVAGAQGVLSALDGVRGSLGGIASAALGTTSALTGVRSGLDLGGQLNDLSARTGQTVRDLVVVRRALDNAGIGGESAAQYIGLLQKAIAGLNEEGGKTDGVFKRLGLDPDQLKNLGVKDQLDALVGGFAKIQNPAERAAMAMQLFGRSGAQMLQLLSDSSAMTTAGREAGRLAQRLQADSGEFDALGDRLSLAKTRMQEFWVVAAEKALPTLQKIADIIERIRPGPVAAAAGNVATIFAAAGAVKFVGALDNAVLEWAKKPGVNVMGQTFAGRFLAPMTGALAKVLPIGLAAVIAAEVTKGIVNGVAQWRGEQIDRANMGFDAVGSARRSVSSIASETDRVNAQTELNALEKETAAALAIEESRWWKNGQAIASYRQQLAEVRSMQQLLNSDYAQSAIAQNLVAASAARRAKAEADAAAFLKGDEATKLREQIAGDIGDRTNPQARLAGARAWLAIQERNLALAKAEKEAGRDTAVNQLVMLRSTAARETALKDIAALEKKIAGLTADEAQTALNAQLRLIQHQRNAVDADIGRTDAQKWPERKRLLDEEIAAQQRYLEVLQQQLKVTDDQAARQALKGQINGGLDKLSSLEGQSGQLGADPNSFTQQIVAGLTQIQNTWGSLQQQIVGGITGAITTATGSVTSNLTQWVMKAKDFKTALGNIRDAIAEQIVSSIIGMGVQWVANLAMMAAKWLATRIGLAVADKSIAAASVAALVPVAMAQSAIWAAPAALATIASFGGAAVQAPAFIAGSMAATQALALFKVGGFVPGAEDDISGLVHGGEFVFSAPAVRGAGGREVLEAYHDAAKSGDMGAFSSAAPVAGAGGSASSGRDDLRAMLGDFAGRIQLVQVNSVREATRIQRRGEAAGDVVAIVRDHWGEITKRGAGA